LLFNETLTSFAPFTASSADCTVDAQEPQVMPLISTATVASFAATAAGIMRTTKSNPRAARIDLVFVTTISTTSAVIMAPKIPVPTLTQDP